MKKVLVGAAAALLWISLIAEIPAPGAKWEFSILSRYSIGDTRYDMTIVDGAESVRSLLVFPIDSIYTGGSLSRTAPGSPWVLGISLFGSVMRPGSLMTDEDWIDLSSEHWYSYTESNLDFSALELALSPDYLLLNLNGLRLFAAADYTLRYYKQQITDYRGYVLEDTNLDGSYDTQTVSPLVVTAALDYWVLYHLLSLGLRARFDLDDRLSINLAAAPTVGLFYDRDVHLLRTKLSTASGMGYGFFSDLSLEYRPGGSGDPLFRLFGGYRWFYSAGTQRQYWFGSADSTPSGTVLSNIPHEVTLSDLQFGLALGFRL